MTNFHPFRCNLCKKSHSRVRIDTEKDQILTKSKSALRFGVFFLGNKSKSVQRRKVFKGEKSWWTRSTKQRWEDLPTLMRINSELITEIILYRDFQKFQFFENFYDEKSRGFKSLPMEISFVSSNKNKSKQFRRGRLRRVGLIR